MSNSTRPNSSAGSAPGLHAVGRRVAKVERRNLLPPVLIARYENDAFWRDPARNPNRVKVV